MSVFIELSEGTLLQPLHMFYKHSYDYSQYLKESDNYLVTQTPAKRQNKIVSRLQHPYRSLLSRL